MMRNLLVFVTIFSSSLVNAESALMTVVIKQVTTDAAGYNGCLVAISPGPESVFKTCRNEQVTLGCDGKAGPTTQAALNNLTAIQLSFLAGRKVHLRIYDTAPSGNPYCLADRVDMTLMQADE